MASTSDDKTLTSDQGFSHGSPETDEGKRKSADDSKAHESKAQDSEAHARKDAAKGARLAQELRANLQKRKAQARARAQARKAQQPKE